MLSVPLSMEIRLFESSEAKFRRRRVPGSQVLRYCAAPCDTIFHGRISLVQPGGPVILSSELANFFDISLFLHAVLEDRLELYPCSR
ncbi:hypothetical protein KM043_018383 [Ampulex compressa]|nr:hypothetical protein KM043_018383 [Ampulex compressa]